LANEILYELGISKSSFEAERFREGSVAPDKWADYPHHYGKEGKIRRYLLEARGSYLKGDMPSTLFNLGVAFHYVQDSYTSLTSRSPKHTSWEEQIEEAQLVSDLANLVEWTFRDRRNLKEEYTRIMRRLSGNIEGEKATLELAVLAGDQYQEYGHPKVDLNFAFRVCNSIAKSVLGPKTNPKLQLELNRVLAEHERVLKETEASFADELVRLVKKREELKKKKKSSGALSSVNNYFLALVGGIYSMRIGRKSKHYKEQRHLKKIAQRYRETAQDKAAPHQQWYNITIPQINIQIVKRELVTKQEASYEFLVSESLIKELAEKGRISLYRIKDTELIRRPELTDALQR
jgi:hypothetical protein